MLCTAVRGLHFLILLLCIDVDSLWVSHKLKFLWQHQFTVPFRIIWPTYDFFKIQKTGGKNSMDVCMMAEQFEMVQYIDIVTQNLICVILRENQHQCTIKTLKECKHRPTNQVYNPQTFCPGFDSEWVQGARHGFGGVCRHWWSKNGENPVCAQEEWHWAH